jgi:hypothetical protein
VRIASLTFLGRCTSKFLLPGPLPGLVEKFAAHGSVLVSVVRLSGGSGEERAAYMHDLRHPSLSYLLDGPGTHSRTRSTCLRL